MAKKGEKISQILQKQSRKYNNNKDVGYIIKKLDIIDGIESIYLGFICSIEDGSEPELEKKDMDEWIKYSPVASFSCLEIYVKSIYSRLIDKGEAHTNNIGQLNVNFNLKEAIEIKNKNITIGDFTSHFIPASNFNNITSNIGLLINLDFIDALKEKYKEKNDIITKMLALDEYMSSKTIEEIISDSNEELEKIEEKTKNENASKFIENLKKLIEVRNLICHENTYDIEGYGFPCEDSSSIVKQFIYLTEEIINNLSKHKTLEK